MANPINAAVFRETLGHYPTGVAVVTGIGADGAPVGMVVGSFTSVSLDPPLVAFLPTKESASWARLREARRFCVNVLASDQEDVCRRFATMGARKFDGASWTPAPGGSPVLDGVVAWIECDHHQVVDAGDHVIVLGAVTEMSVTRPSLPLLFFQGGYGRFSPSSISAPTNPDALLAAQVAEGMRERLEVLAHQHQTNCSVLTQVGTDSLFVLTVNQAPDAIGVSVGNRIPLVPPLGNVFLIDAPEAEVQDWIDRSPVREPGTVQLFRQNLELVRRRGYSLSLALDEGIDRRGLVQQYSSADGTPASTKHFKETIVASARLHDPEIIPGRTYSLSSIIVPVKVPAGVPPIALRMAELPPDASAATVRQWIADLMSTAHRAAVGISRRRELPAGPSRPTTHHTTSQGDPSWQTA